MTNDMSPDLIVQNMVIGLIMAGVVWFAIRQYLERVSVPAGLSEGDELGLVKVRHVRNGEHMHWGRADSSSGGRLILGSDHLSLKWGLGFKTTKIEHEHMRNLRSKPFGLIDFVVFDVRDEDHYWVLGMRRPKALALLEWLSARGIKRVSQNDTDLLPEDRS